MATREEIREGIYALFSNCFTRGKLSGRNRDAWASKYTNTLMSDLHSQGLVIKVNRALPDISYHSAYPENEEQYQQAMLKAGYVATEPLVEK